MGKWVNLRFKTTAQILSLYYLFTYVNISHAKTIIISTPKSWALATTAILAERNSMRHDTLCGADRAKEDISGWKRLLSEWWDINDRQDLLNTLRWIEDEGHRALFDEMGKKVSIMTDANIKKIISRNDLDDNTKSRIVIAWKYHRFLGKKSLIGWDYVRYNMLCRWGFLVGYLSEKEAWNRIMPAARLIQKTFGSWKELGENYLIGRAFWSAEATGIGGAKYVDAYNKLLKSQDSPWKIHPWKMKLN